jgi:tape measure domain-containing protein
MRWQDSGFARGVSSTISALEKLRQSLNMTGASKGMNELKAETGRFNLNPMQRSIEEVSKTWLAMTTIALTAISRITSAVVASAGRFAKSFTVGPLVDGLHEYETNLNAIQTILANTGLSGQAGLAKVNAALDELNTYSDKTIYNFSEMARNIGTFTAAGVSLDKSTAAIKGIANLAAVSGSNSQQASTAMYQLSQALAAGKVSLMDWNSVVNAGMGGKVFQNALMETARVHGVAVDKIVKEEGSFRASVSKGWITSEIMTETLAKFTGDLSAAQLKSMGYNEKQIKGIMAMGKTATDAATKVKTMSQLISTLQESAGSGWAKTWQLVFGDFDQAKELFTGVNNVLGGMIQRSADARNKVLGDWNKLGGRTTVIAAISNIFHALADVVGTVKDAFHDIFPPMTGRRLYELTAGFRDFTEHLKLSDTTLENLRRTFRGVFAVFSIIGQIIGGVISVFAELFGAVGEGTGGFLNFTGGIGDFLVSVDQALKKGDRLKNFFHDIASVLKVPIRLIQQFAGFLTGLFDGGDSSGVASSFQSLADAMTPLEALGERVRAIFGDLPSVFGRIMDALSGLAPRVADALSQVSQAIADAFSGGNYSTILDTLNTVLFGGLLLLVRKFIKGFSSGLGGNGLIGSIKGVFGQLTSTMKTLQTSVQSKTLMRIAEAIALLTVSVVALSLIDSAKLTKALSAMAAGFGELLASMAVLVKVSGSAGFVKVPLIAASMVLLATALTILAGAIALFGQMDWETLGKGLTGVAGALVVVAGGMQLMPKNLPITAAGLILVGIGLSAIVGALKLMAMLDWSEIGKGLAGVAGALLVIAGAMQLMPTTLPITAAGLVLTGIALGLIGGAMKIFATMDWEQIGKGLVAVGGALLIIAGAMNLMPATLPITAAGLVLVGIALGGIAAAVKLMATMSWEEIAKGLVVLGGAMLILAIGLNAMIPTLPGSASLLVAAAALAVLAPVLVVLSQLSWEGIAKGMVVLAGAFTVLGIAGLLLTPLAPTIALLGLSLLAIGAGLALAGAGAIAFATGASMLVGLGNALAKTVASVLKVIIDSIPAAMGAFGRGIAAFANAIAQAGPAFLRAFTTILTSLLNSVIKVTPLIGRALTVLVQTGISVLNRNIPGMVAAGFRLLQAILTGIANNIGRITGTVGTIIVRFLGEMGKQMPRITDAGVKLIIAFINGCATAIDKHSGEMGAAGGRLGVAIVTGMVKGIGGGISAVATAAKNLAKGAFDAAMGFLDAHSPSKLFMKVGSYITKGLVIGLVGGYPEVKATLDKLKTYFTDNAASIKRTLDSQKRHLAVLQRARHPNKKAIRAQKKAVAQSQSEYNRLVAAQKATNAQMARQQTKLLTLSKQYDTVTAKLKAATDALNEAKKVRDDFQKSTTDKFNVLPEIDENTTLLGYMDQIRKQTGDVEKFKATLDKLRAMGMDDASYQKFLDEGIGSQQFLDQIIASGPAAVAAINDLNAHLASAAGALGSKAAHDLYDAGVNAAQGIVDGLAKQQKTIEKMMTNIATAMLKAIKKALGIKSPSKEFEKVGKWSNEGLAKGLEKYGRQVERSAEQVGYNALDTLKKSMITLSDAMAMESQLNPVVAPVIDLTQFRKDASQIGALVPKVPVDADVSYKQAASIFAKLDAARAESTADIEETPQTLVQFTQNNNSPKALSNAEIYRQTKNQLSVTKGALSTK